MKLSGAQAIIKVLLEQEVDTVFGYPGGQVIPLYNRYGTGYSLFRFRTAGSDYGTGFCCKFRQRLFSGNRYCRCDIADNEI